MGKPTTIQLFKNIRSLIEQSRRALYQVANTALVETYFHVGRMIVDHEQQGSNRAAYAKETLKKLSERLLTTLGRGFSVDNLENMRKFYLVYKDDYNKYVLKNTKSETLYRKLALPPFKLTWSQYIFLSNIEDRSERRFYEIEAATELWSLRELRRHYDSALFQRLALSRDKKKLRELSKKGHVIEKPADVIKDPYILEFLNLPQKDAYSENDLEIKTPEENKTIGIILCRNKKGSTIKYTLGKDNKQIFESKYKIYFPEKQLLKIVRENI